MGAMSGLMVVLLPPWPDDAWSWDHIATGLTEFSQPVLEVPDLPENATDSPLDLAGAWVAHCALEIARCQSHLPLLLVAHGTSARMIAAVGFSQRASGRQVVGYALIDGDLPSPGLQDWPDAPVTYVGERESTLARLRGWDVQPVGDLAAQLHEVAIVSV